MSDFDEQFETGATPQLFAALGDTAAGTYAPIGGQPVPFSAILGDLLTSEEEDAMGSGRSRRRTVDVTDDPDHDDYPGIVDPAVGAEIVIGDFAYSIDAVDKSGNIHTLTLLRTGVKQRGSGGP